MIPLKTVSIEVTNRCNGKCTFCPHGTNKLTRKKTTMSNDLFFHLVDICKKENIPNISIGGLGEFLLDKDLFIKIKYITDSGLTFSNFTTNASLLNEVVSQKLIDSGLKQIIFSLDSVDKERYESMRIGLSYNKVINNIVRFIELNDGRIHIIINAIKEKNMHKQIKSFKQTFKPYLDGGKRVAIAFSPVHNWADGKIPIFVALKVRILNCIKHRFCGRLFGDLAQIRVDDSMALCCMDYNNVVKIGKVKDTITGLYNGEKMNNIRQLHKSGKWNSIDVCRKCSSMYSDGGVKYLK